MHPHRLLRILPLRLRSLLRRPLVERELDDELRDHVDRQTADNIARGMDPASAHRAAVVAMGGIENRKEQVRDTRGTQWLEELVQDVRYAARTLRRSPAFLAVAASTLALGIGANTALFTLLDVVVLRTLPVREPDGLVIAQRMSRSPDGSISPRSMPYASFERLRRENTVMERMAAVAITSSVGVRYGHDAELLAHGAALVSGDFFPLLGVQAQIGRVLDPSDELTGAPPVAVISHDYWTVRFARDSSVVGRSVEVNGSPMKVVGVAPAGFFGVSLGSNPDMYFPIPTAPIVNRSPTVLQPSNGFLSVMGRLRPGVSPEQASRQLGPMYIRARIETGGGVADERTLKRYEGTSVAVQSGAHGLLFLRRQFGKALIVLMGMVGLVLLVACGNIANLLMARAVVRGREIGIRLSVGAGRRRIVRQLVTESLVLSLIGGALGLVVARAGVRALVALLGRGSWQPVLDVDPDPRILAFTLLVSVVTGVVFGLAPALRATRVDLATILREGGRGGSGTRGQLGFGRGLIVAQVALSVVLLVGTGLFVRSLVALRRIDLGFARENVVLVHMDPRRSGYERARLSALYRDLLARAAAMPGVRTAALADITPLSGSASGSTVTVEGFTPPPDEPSNVFIVKATPEYFAAIGLPVLAGSMIRTRPGLFPHDAMVNESFVRRFGRPGVLGRRAGFNGNAAPLDLEIVGVVKNSPLRELREQPLPLVYLSFLDDSVPGDASLVLRAASPAEDVIRDARAMVRGVDPRLELLRVTTLVAQVDGTIVREQLVATIAAFFGVLALLLASIGLYGVVSQTVVRRTNEIGIRMALGATREAVTGQILRQALTTVLIGIGVGIPASLAAGRGVSSLLYGVAPTDARTIVACVLTLVSVAIAASWVPARRASRIDPASALRAD
jgi:predicted permease